MTAAAPRAPQRWPPSVIPLLLVNAIPLVGVLAHHWTVFVVLLLYWCENVVVGAFNVLRMVCAYPQVSIAWVGKLFVIPFFMVHYGMFTFVHGIFVLSLFGGGQTHGGGGGASGVPALIEAVRQAQLGVAVAALVGSHRFSFVHNYLANGEYRRVQLTQLMTLPYRRVAVLHITILGGGLLVTALGSPLPALVVLILGKTAIDVATHRAERNNLAETSIAPAHWN